MTTTPYQMHEDHRRVREASEARFLRYEVSPCLPVDVIGLYVLLAEQFLKPEISFEKLDEEANEMGDNEAAERMNKARAYSLQNYWNG